MPLGQSQQRSSKRSRRAVAAVLVAHLWQFLINDGNIYRFKNNTNTGRRQILVDNLANCTIPSTYIRQMLVAVAM